MTTHYLIYRHLGQPTDSENPLGKSATSEQHPIEDITKWFRVPLGKFDPEKLIWISGLMYDDQTLYTKLLPLIEEFKMRTSMLVFTMEGNIWPADYYLAKKPDSPDLDTNVEVELKKVLGSNNVL